MDIERPCKVTCPVDAVQIDENDLAMIDEAKCINCGQCVVACPFGAIGDASMMTNVINSIRTSDNVYAMIAPAIEGQFGDVTVPQLKEAIKLLALSTVLKLLLVLML